jgi:hypothetical protein
VKLPYRIALYYTLIASVLWFAAYAAMARPLPTFCGIFP